MAGRAPAPPKKDEAPLKKPRRRPAKKKSAPQKPSGVWSWKTPNEALKLRLAAGLIAILACLVTCWSGELKSSNGTWRAGFRGLRGELVLGLQWRRGQWPTRWVAR